MEWGMDWGMDISEMIRRKQMENNVKLLLTEAEEMLNKRFIEGSHKPGRRIDPVSVNRLHNVRLSDNTRRRLMKLLVIK